jgi:hypothetical protein
MTIEPAFQIRLGIYGIDADVRSMRREIWELIKPHLGQITSGSQSSITRRRGTRPIRARCG